MGLHLLHWLLALLLESSSRCAAGKATRCAAGHLGWAFSETHAADAAGLGDFLLRATDLFLHRNCPLIVCRMMAARNLAVPVGNTCGVPLREGTAGGGGVIFAVLARNRQTTHQRGLAFFFGFFRVLGSGCIASISA